MSVALISGFSTLPRPVRRLEASSKGASGPPRGQGRDSAPRRPPAPTNSLALCAVGRDEWLKHPFARLFKRRRAWVETRVRRCRGGLAASGWRKGGPNCESPAISPSNHSRSSFHPALSGDRAVRRTMGEGATEYRQSQQLPLSSRANATTARILCCDPDHSTLGNNVLGLPYCPVSFGASYELGTSCCGFRICDLSREQRCRRWNAASGRGARKPRCP
jgi:hypothetical protein